ncbi:MAG: DUF192 domain-containing protein [Pseudomonadota bacterium]
MKIKDKTLWVISGIIFAVILIFVFFQKNKCVKKDNAICVIAAGAHKIKAKVAYSRQAQTKGLMGVNDLGDGEGMIFVYDDPEQLSFWMKNTLIPLDIAFIEADGRIAIIHNMRTELGKPDFVLPTYASPVPVKFAVEVPVGWFASKGIKAMDYLVIPKELQ